MNMELVITAFLSAITAIFGASGFWAYMIERKKRKEKLENMIRALAHDKIVHLCKIHIQNGYITAEEHENLIQLYEPYVDMHGNGYAERLMCIVQKLDLKQSSDLLGEQNVCK